ncbi:MAG TPA: serine/threonine protein kinase [Verrucomicrobiales bacterium]|nr:serine/threonine protein kinase [Verrucomicrobiales bacterium]
MSHPSDREVELFNAALQLPAGERPAFLLAECRGDAGLQHRIETLLEAHQVAGNFMEGTSPVDTAAGIARHREAPTGGPPDFIAEKPGDRIGRYKLLEKLGEGGWGVVYVAEQVEPVRRRVALKIIKPGMDSRSVIARFEAERQALALMDHPGIARVYDAGTTETGRPFFIMELVRGMKITRFCDENRLNPRERLHLFEQVCHAVQHAHQKGIIHRDLKPSNILVTISHPDSPGIPKVIDFGIAKATQGRLTNKTVFTAFEQFIGTPAYMSPEQAVMTSLEVDTRSDIYSLGVLLYELLTGQPPFDQQELLEAGLDAMRQVIRERDPVRPSTRLSRMNQGDLTDVARFRQSDPPRLIHAIRGDLDWIVMKCLQKDRARRYETANGLAMDVARFLKNEPVLARPDSRGYRAAKFVRRHRSFVTFAALIFLALAGGLLGTITQARRATRHAVRADNEARAAEKQRDFALRQLSRAEALNDLNTFLLSDAAPSGNPFTVGELLAQAEQLSVTSTSDAVENRVEILVSLGRQYEIMDQHGKAREVLGKAYELSRPLSEPSIRAKAAAALASAVALGGEFQRGESLVREALAELPDEPQYAIHRVFCLLHAGRVAREGGDSSRGLEHVLEGQRILVASGQGSALLQLIVAGEVAEAYRMDGRNREADLAFAAAFARLTALGRENTERAGTFLNNWGLVLHALGRPLEAERHFRRAIAISSADGTEEQVSPMLLNNLARELADLHRLDEAADYAERAYARAQQLGSEIVINQSLSVRTAVYREQGRLDLAAQTLAELELRWNRQLPPGHIAFAAMASHQAQLALARGDLPAALAAADRAVSLATTNQVSHEALPAMLIPRANIRLRAGDFGGALADADGAIAMEQEAAGPGAWSRWVGRAQLIRGRLYIAQDQTEPARLAFAAALAHLRPTVGAEHPETREAATAIAQ